MRVAVLLLALTLSPLSIAAAQDQLSEARRLYNTQQFEAAERAARAATAQPRAANSARVVLARILLERYRQSSNPAHLTEARDALRGDNPTTLEPAGIPAVSAP